MNVKLNIIPCIIVLAVCALLSYGIYNWCRCESMSLLVAILGGVSIALPLGFTTSISAQDPRKTINIRVASGTFVTLLLLSNIIFCCLTEFSQVTYIIVNGLLMLIWTFVIYGILKS